MKVCPRCRLRYEDDVRHCTVDGAELIVRADPLIGVTLDGRFTIDRLLGEGGQGAVYAGHGHGGEPVAIKVLHSYLGSDPILRERFRREGEHAASLAHPHIVRIHGVGETPDHRPFIAMELLAGAGLDRVVDGKPLPIATVLAIGAQLADALARAHDLGFVHRDIKPSNVIVGTDAQGLPQIKLVDFGLARRITEPAGAPKLTRRGEILGTPSYVAPELLRGAPVSPSVDLYGMGCLLFEMLTGAPPFVRESIPAILLAHLEDAPAPVRSRRADCPAALATLVDALLAKDPEERPAHAHQVHAALSALAAEHEPRPSTERVAGPLTSGPASTTLERRRTAAVELMRRARAEPRARDATTELEAALASLSIADAEVLRLRDQVRSIEDAAHEARERLSHAAQEVGRDLSEARVLARTAEVAARVASVSDGEARAAFERADHAMARLWTGRQMGPSLALADALDETSRALRAWAAAREALDAARVEVAACNVRAHDLEQQLGTLRRRLAEVGSSTDGARAKPAAELVRASGQREALDERVTRAMRTLAELVGPDRGTA